MNKLTWEDNTSYSHSELSLQLRDRKPRSWRLGRLHSSSIVVHRHTLTPDVWFLTCYDLAIERLRLRSIDLPDAQTEALAYVAKKIKGLNEYYKHLGVEL